MQLNLDPPGCECKAVMCLIAKKEVVQKPRKKLIVYAHAMRYRRHVERAELMACRSADLVQSVDLSSVRVLSSPVAGEFCARAQKNGFTANVAIHILDKQCVNLIAYFFLLLSVERLVWLWWTSPAGKSRNFLCAGVVILDELFVLIWQQQRAIIMGRSNGCLMRCGE